MYRYYPARMAFIVDIHHPFFAFQFLKILLTAGIEICASRASVDLWRAFAGTAVPESRICYGGESLIVNAGSHLH